MIIDQKTCLDINERTFLNELTTLHVLHAGLQKLYLDVKEVEAPIVNYELENRKKVTFFGFGNVERFGLPIEVEPLLTCYFHWFAVTVCNYVKLVGYLDGCAKGVIQHHRSGEPLETKKTTRHCDQYIRSVEQLEQVVFWRNKIYAHFAVTAPFKDDHPALLDVSTMSPLSFAQSRFRAGAGMIAVDVEMPSWSLTEVFECLSEQFWPDTPP